jgi:hypothetical protein
MVMVCNFVVKLMQHNEREKTDNDNKVVNVSAKNLHKKAGLIKSAWKPLFSTGESGFNPRQRRGFFSLPVSRQALE